MLFLVAPQYCVWNCKHCRMGICSLIANMPVNVLPVCKLTSNILVVANKTETKRKKIDAEKLCAKHTFISTESRKTGWHLQWLITHFTLKTNTSKSRRSRRVRCSSFEKYFLPNHLIKFIDKKIWIWHWYETEQHTRATTNNNNKSRRKSSHSHTHAHKHRLSMNYDSNVRIRSDEIKS